MIKRSYADVLVNRNEVVNEGANEVKSVEKTKIDQRNITDNRAMRNKVKREEKRDGSLEKIDLKKIYSQLLEEEQSRSGDRNKSTPPNISTNSSQLKNDSGFSPIEENIFLHKTKSFFQYWRNCRMPMSPIILIQLLGISRLAHQRKIQYLLSLLKT